MSPLSSNKPPQGLIEFYLKFKAKQYLNRSLMRRSNCSDLRYLKSEKHEEMQSILQEASKIIFERTYFQLICRFRNISFVEYITNNLDFLRGTLRFALSLWN